MSPTEPRPDRRRLFLFITGGVVLVALAAAALVTVLGGDDGEEPEEPARPIQTVRFTAPPDASAVIDVNGAPVQLTPEQLTAVTAVLETYLTNATVRPLSTAPPEEDEETTTTAVPVDPLTASFTDQAAARLETDDRLALSDAHLPFAKDGVTFSTATVKLAGIVVDGAPQFLNATIETVAVVGAEEEPITVRRKGDLVLRPVDASWKIAGYDLTVERAFGDRTTTTEAAFG